MIQNNFPVMYINDKVVGLIQGFEIFENKINLKRLEIFKDELWDAISDFKEEHIYDYSKFTGYPFTIILHDYEDEHKKEIYSNCLINNYSTAYVAGDKFLKTVFTNVNIDYNSHSEQKSI